MKKDVSLAGAALFFLVFNGMSGVWAAQEVVFHLMDADRGGPIAARCELTDPRGNHLFPSDIPEPGPSDPDYFYAWEKFPVELKTDVEYTLRLERGLGWNPVIEKFTIQKNTREATVGMTSWYRAEDNGWLAADFEGRFSYYEPGLAMDAQEISVLSRVVDAYRAITDSERIAKGIFRLGDERVYLGRDWGFGDFNVIGTTLEVVPPNETPFTASGIYYMEKGKKMGGLIDVVRPEGEEIPVAVALDLVDTMRVVGPERVAEVQTDKEKVLKRFEAYYDYLNCGYRIPVSAGSKATERGLCETDRIGNARLYCRLTHEFTLGLYLRTAKRGRSWATNGPVLSLTVGGNDPGTVIQPPQPGGRLRVSFGARSPRPIEVVELLFNGVAIDSVSGATDSDYVIGEHEFAVTESGWLAARVFEAQESPDDPLRYAHTSPVYIEIDKKPVHKRDSLKKMVDLLRKRMSEIAADKDLSRDEKRTVLNWYVEALNRYSIRF